MTSDLARAEAFILSYKNDSATVILTRLMGQLREQKRLDSPFGLRVQLAQGIVFEHNDRDTAAAHLLLYVKGSSQAKKLWDTYIKASLALANLHENMMRGNQCLSNLKDAQFAIKQHGLDSLYPYFAIRMSSFHRVFEVNLDTAMYYAEDVLRTAPKYGQTLYEAWGHMLIAMLLGKKDAEKTLENFRAAIPLFLKIDDSKGLSSLMGNVSKHYYLKKESSKALAYNDSSIVFAKKSIALGDNMSTNLFTAYKFRGEIYKQMGWPDSAWHYLKKGYDLQLEYSKLLQDSKVIEIDARYNDEKRLQEIAAQAREIKAEKARRNLLVFIVLVVLLLASALAYFYRQLQKANRKTAEQAEQLKNLDAAKSRFFANVSHELRTPLTLVLSPITSLLKENQLTERQTRLIQTAHQSGKELQQLVNEILDLQKLEVGKMELNERPTTLAPFFERYAAQFQSLADRKQIDFSIETTLDNELSASIDQEKCRQILYNLLSNAFKFTPPGGEVKVKLEIGNWEINEQGKPISQFPISIFQITVSDSGLGIHPEDLPHVFDHFFQTSRPDKPAEGGTGIGLALCHEYAKLFGGTITAESTLGKGTVLRVAFPVKLVDSPSSVVGSLELDSLPAAAANSLVNKPNPQVATETQKPTILVVEDNHALQDYIRLILEEKYNVVTAENGRVALDWLLPASNCQLILSDLMMPVMDGYQLLEKLKSGDATRHIPVIMLTARAEAKDRLKALRIGVDDYLTKPFDEEELLVRIENLLANSRNRYSAIASDKPDTNLPVTEDAATDVPFISEPDRVWLESFEAFVQKNIANELLNIPFLASEFAMSESTLLRQLKRLTGLSSVQYLQEVRLDKARHLLENRSYDSISKVADKVGYSDLRSFSRSFKQRFGKSPSDFLSA